MKYKKRIDVPVVEELEDISEGLGFAGFVLES